MRLHSAIGYIAPADKLAGKEEAIFAARDQKLLRARENRKAKRNQDHKHPLISCQPNFFQLTRNQYSQVAKELKREGWYAWVSDYESIILRIELVRAKART